ncbi:hypothetical protein HX850_04485 [Marine Group I thaumarchaeote]|uniref:DUF6998 domain-containing protein n=1 Tax=Marine Group I thaumarchaeote TaxID=2511932 RepID=A0A7K4MLT8_9ARCH|nr:hypothetical protein [Marine Group I thaumarchaeote]
MEKENKVEAVKGIIASLYASQKSLRALAPEFKWAGLGNLLGDFGEFVAIEHYGLNKAPPGSNGFDALTSDGKTVQIKANHAAKQIGFRGNADLLLVIHVENNGEWSEVYYGSFGKVLDLSTFSERDNKRMISITKLVKISLDSKDN